MTDTMKEDPVFFTAGNITLEGRFHQGSGSGGAVVSHPHSQMGGSLHNNVVEALVSAFADRGLSTLRFNFRGVGRSEGTFDDGAGEQQDVLGALSFLASKGVTDTILAGYSFGAWVNAKLSEDRDRYSRIIMVSPPMGLLSFDPSFIEATGGLVVSGDSDPYCTRDSLGEFEAAGWTVRLIPGADHFYGGYEKDLKTLVRAYLDGR